MLEVPHDIERPFVLAKLLRRHAVYHIGIDSDVVWFGLQLVFVVKIAECPILPAVDPLRHVLTPPLE